MDIEPDEAGEGAADVAYKWVVRGLYAVAIGLNVWLLLDAATDDADLAVLRARAVSVWNRATRRLRLSGHVRRSVGPMLWEAIRIVEAPAPAAEGDGE